MFQYPQRAGCGCNGMLHLLNALDLSCFSTLNGRDVVATATELSDRLEAGCFSTLNAGRMWLQRGATDTPVPTWTFQYPQRAGCGCNAMVSAFITLRVPSFQYPQRAGCGCNTRKRRLVLCWLVSVPSTGRMWLQLKDQTQTAVYSRCFSTLNGQDVVATGSRLGSGMGIRFQYPQRAGCGCNLVSPLKIASPTVSVPSTGRMWLHPEKIAHLLYDHVSVPSTGRMWLQHERIRDVDLAHACFSTLNGQDVVATSS